MGKKLKPKDIRHPEESLARCQTLIGIGYLMELEWANGRRNGEIPEAPTLAPLRYDVLPEHFRDIVSTENSNVLNTSIRRKQSEGKNFERSYGSHIGQKRRINVKADNIADSEMSEVISDGHRSTRLKSRNGYMWRLRMYPPAEQGCGLNLISEPSMSLQIITPQSDPVNRSDSSQEELVSDSENPKINTEENRTEGERDNTVEESTADSDLDEGPGEAFPPGTWGVRLTSGDGYVWNDLANHPGSIFHVGNPETENEQINITTTSASPGNMEESEDYKGEYNKEDAPVLLYPTKVNENSGCPIPHPSDILFLSNKTGHALVTPVSTAKSSFSEMEDDNPFIYDQDMHRFAENDPFWNWLDGWTSTYVKKLVERGGKSDQRKNRTNQKDKIDKINNEPSPNPNGKIDEDTDEETEKAGENTTDEKAPADKKDVKQTSKPRKNKDIIGKPHNNRDYSKESKDAFQSPIPEINSKLDVDNKETKSEHTEEPGTDIKATIIYGNSVANDKVTNIYVFYPRPDDAVEQLKPLLDVITSKNESGQSTQRPAITVNSRIDGPENKDAATPSRNSNNSDDQIDDINVKGQYKVDEMKEDDFKNTKKDSGNSENSDEYSRNNLKGLPAIREKPRYFDTIQNFEKEFDVNDRHKKVYESKGNTNSDTKNEDFKANIVINSAANEEIGLSRYSTNKSKDVNESGDTTKQRGKREKRGKRNEERNGMETRETGREWDNKKNDSESDGPNENFDKNS
ncbi:hypothetical protein EVAR_33282_1 [Eumeta japonica]|uniref:Uncharacterized protein n=1 Tax=Eumeta variegata TaxID=151549 RepID=A0A4C1X0Q2_EUMVA|nr:hypothetical protein EVAR_33282_1 [Eumeta japonica]